MADEYELVGIGKHKLGSMDGWCVTYMLSPPEEEGGVPDFRHHMFPAVIFSNYAKQFGLDISDDEDFNEIVEIVLYDGFAGYDDPLDDVDDEIQSFAAVGNGRKKQLSKVGRKMRKRANRGKQSANITGLGVDGIRERISPERYIGADEMEERLSRLERVRASGTGERPEPRGSRAPRGVGDDEASSG